MASLDPSGVPGNYCSHSRPSAFDFVSLASCSDVRKQGLRLEAPRGQKKIES